MSQHWDDLERSALLLMLNRCYGNPNNPNLGDEIELAEAATLGAALKILGMRTSMLTMVEEFSKTFEEPLADRPMKVPELDPKMMEVRFDLLVGELREYMEAAMQDDTVGIFDGLLDLLYSTLFVLRTFFPGFMVEEGFAEVHRSNMTKLGEDGRPVRDENGRIGKGPNFEEPNLARILEMGDEDGD